ncbi:hypothetical protein Slin15195_G016400 [Septoria linicola]|uniref:Uncharacterized protein n=1 Tax=Septoria linicola TaxID=215465 RepID=A0A9Q9ALW2_9PEZI|nr:hypothetical protein Slin15195_G016400 [Septoria linicola]
MASLPHLAIYRPYQNSAPRAPQTGSTEDYEIPTGLRDQTPGVNSQDPFDSVDVARPQAELEGPPPYSPSSLDNIHGPRPYPDIGRIVPGDCSLRSYPDPTSPDSSPADTISTYSPAANEKSFPRLAEYGISRSDFLTFIDELNEHWVANPALDGVRLVGTIMGQFHGLPVVQLVGTGVEIGAGVSSAATSIARSKMYFKAINTKLFHLVGLHAQTCSTKEMLAKIGHSGEELKLAPVEMADQLGGSAIVDESGHSSTLAVAEDSRMRRMKALEGYAAPLDFNVPETVAPRNLLKKMGHAHAEHMVKKQTKREVRKRAEDADDRDKKTIKADKETRRALERVEEAEEKGQDRVRKEFEKEEKRLIKEIDKEQQKCDRELKKQSQKSAKDVAKPKDREEEATQKIQWVVITRWFGEVGEDAGSDDAPS